MIDINIKRIVQFVREVTNSHLKSEDDSVMLSRDWESIFQDFNGWVILSATSYPTKGYGGFYLFPELSPENQIEDIKSNIPNSIPEQESGAFYPVVGGGEDHRIEPCWRNKPFNEGQIPFYFRRQHYGRPKGKENYLEFNQAVTHPLGLHWSEAKQAFCIVDDHGDEVEKIKIVTDDKIELVLIRRHTLDTLLHLGQWRLIRYFTFTRWRNNNPPFDTKGTFEMLVPTEYDAKFRRRSFSRDKIEFIEFAGAQFEQPKSPKEKVLDSWSLDSNEEEKKYGSFIVQDWKNNQILRDYSIKPDNFANYFTESDKPFEVSPIFFRAEVLDKYKNNPDKYELKERTITCRGGWYLQSYDINEYNQVHTYAIYLGRLPFKEQLHWQQYNEEPKGTISKQAYKTDFEAKFPEELSQMNQLKRALTAFEKVTVEGMGQIWSPLGGTWETASKGLHPVHTENANQWHDFVIALANLTKEGLQTSTLRKIAEHFGCTDKNVRSLGLIKFILEASGNEKLIPTTHTVLNQLNSDRGQGKAHGEWKSPEGLSLIEDSKNKMAATITAIQQLTEFFSTLVVNAPKT